MSPRPSASLLARRLALVSLAAALVACGGPAPSDAGDARSPSADAPADAPASPMDAPADTPTPLPPDAPADTPALDAPTPDTPAPPDAPPPDAPRANPLTGIGPVELVREGFMFTEGPQWRRDMNALVFSDIPANTIHMLREPGTFSVFRMPSGNSNGLAVDAMNRLLAAEHGNRRVSRTAADGTVSTVVDRFMGMRLNSPNDLIVRSDGTIYFTDPPYGLGGAPRELPFMGVFRVAPGATPTLTAEYRGPLSARPNGIALSPDERVLYVVDSEAGTVTAWDVQPDGSLAGMRMLARTGGGGDGMAVDRDGNLFVTASMGIVVFAPDGRMWGRIMVPRVPANCAFGGADARTLYITAREGLYRVRLTIPGIY